MMRVIHSILRWRVRGRRPPALRSAITMDPRRLLAEEWANVERLITVTCRRRGLDEADGDEFASMVKVKLFENDCEIVKRFRGDCKFSTYVNVIVQRTFVDLCVKRLGKWHPSAAAERMGAAGLELERMVFRDGCAPEDAIVRVLARYAGLDRRCAEEMLSRIPHRQRRWSSVPIDSVADSLHSDAAADVLALSGDRRRISDRTAAVVREYLRNLEETDRLLLQLHFESDMQLAQIARVLGIEQKPLYRRRNQMLGELRARIESSRISASEVADLFGNLPEDSDFGLRRRDVSPGEIAVQTEMP